MLNLKVYINNIYESLELPEDFTISIQYNSGIWNFESIPGSYSIPFELINTIQNNRLLSYPHNLSNIIQSKRRLIAQLWVNDLLLHAGILEVEETTNQNFKCVFKFDTGAFASEFKDILLTDCELGGEQNWIWKNDYNNSNSDFALSQIKNNSFLVGSGFRTEPFPEEESFFINWYSTYNDKYYFEVFKIFPGYSVLPIPVVPFPYLFKIIQYLFNSIGYNLKSNFFSSTDDLKKLLIYNINDAEQSTTHFDLQFNTQRVDYILDTFNLKNHVPEISISEFILNLKNFFCIDFNFRDDEISINPIQNYINSNDFIDITDKVLEGETKYFKEIKTGFSIEFKTDTNDEYLKQIDDIKKYYTKDLKVSYNPIDIDLSSGNFKDLVLYHNILGNNFASFWHKCFYQDDNFHVSPTWKQIVYGEFGYYYSNFKTEISFQSNISQFLNIKLMQPGNSVFHYNSKSEFNLRLCFDSGKRTAPFSNEIVPQADNHTENLHLNFWSEKGLFKTFWKSFTDWYFNIPYELDLKIQFSLADLKRLDFTKKYLINNQLYFIDSIKVVIHLNGTLEPALVRVLPC